MDPAVEEVYYEDFIKKRELKDRWVRFWARLLGEKIYLYVSKDCKEVDFCEIIWLSSCSRCFLLKRRNYSFRFRLTKSDGSYYLKCDSNLQRHRWIHMIHLACSGRSPELPPNHINMRCCYPQEREPYMIGNSGSTKQSHDGENERVTETSDEKETIGEKESSKTSPRGASLEEMAQMESGSSKQSSNKNNGSIGSEEYVDPEVKDMKESSSETHKESENDTKKEKYSCGVANDKISDSSTTVRSMDIDPPAAKQTFSLKTFTFGSFRKSLKRQSYPPNRNKEAGPSKDNRNYISHASFEEKIQYSMDNPAFTDDDSGNIKEINYTESSYQTTEVINVVPCNL